jgi:hypothetical protein
MWCGFLFLCVFVVCVFVTCAFMYRTIECSVSLYVFVV